MILLIDVGNSNLTCGLYKPDAPLEQARGATFRIETLVKRPADGYGLELLQLCSFFLQGQTLKNVVVASVVPALTPTLLKAVRTYLKLEPVLLTPLTPSPITVTYDPPTSVGTDRIVDAVAVWHLYGGPACIIDFGTATTFNALTADGTYLGGAIATGIQTSAEALFAKAAKLPSVDIVAPPEVIGRNTTHAIQSGLVFGYACMVEGMVARFKQALGENTKVIATGGLAGVLQAHTSVIDVVAPHLTLDGMYLMWQHSVIDG